MNRGNVELSCGSDDVGIGVSHGRVERDVSFVPIVDEVAECVRVKLDETRSGRSFGSDAAPRRAQGLSVAVGSPNNADGNLCESRLVRLQFIGNVRRGDKTFTAIGAGADHELLRKAVRENV